MLSSETPGGLAPGIYWYAQFGQFDILFPIQLMRHVSTGIIVPACGFLWRIPFPAILGAFFFLTTALAYLLGFPVRDVDRFTSPAVGRCNCRIFLVRLEPVGFG